MKAVLVIDMPNNCSECPYYHKADTYWGDRCSLKFKDVDDYLKLGSGRPSWCPLRPMPQKVELDINEYYKGMADGWNACIEEIVGDNEDEV